MFQLLFNIRITVTHATAWCLWSNVIKSAACEWSHFVTVLNLRFITRNDLIEVVEKSTCKGYNNVSAAS